MTIRLHPALFFLITTALAVLVLAGCPASDDDDDTALDDDDVNDDDDDDNDDNDDDDNTTGEGPYYQDFLSYWMTLDEGYAYFAQKGVDWQAVFDQHAPGAYAQTDRVSFALQIAGISASLHDSHTWVSLAGVPNDRMPSRQSTGVCLMRAGGSVVVSRLTAQAQAAGLELGDEVTALDGEPVDQVLARATSWEGCSSPHCCDAWRLPHVDRYSAGNDTVTYAVMRGATPLSFELARTGAGSGTCKPQPLLDFLQGASGSVLKYNPIDDDLGYLHLDTLSDSARTQILQDLDQALADFAGRSGLIFDARTNHGGSDLVVMRVLARFLDRLVAPVDFRYRNGPEHDDFTLWIPEPVLPGINPITVPVVFLIDAGCISAADFFAAAASYVPSFTLMGQTSCGATGAPDSDTLAASGILFTWSQMQRRYRATGQQIEGIGVAPDMVVEPDPADLVLGIDTMIEAAISHLRTAAGP